MDWSNIRHFQQKEFDDPLYPGSGEGIDSALVYKMDTMRGRAEEEDPQVKCIIHGKVGGAVDVAGKHGHALNSFHLKWNGAKAVDFHFKTHIDPRLQYFLWVEPMKFPAIGIYYCWHWNGKLLPVGFHIDLRPTHRVQRWTCREKGKYEYLLGRSN
jgi:hypothetical protein